MKERISNLLFKASAWAALFFSGLLIGGTTQGEIIPADRRVNWQGNVGVPGGVPNRTTIFANVRNAPYNAVGNGVADDTAAIQSALNACPAGQVVYIPTGTYHVTSSLQLKGSYTVRGDGPGLTIIDNYGSSGTEIFAVGKPGQGSFNAYNIFNSQAGTPVSITAGANLGSSNITVASAAQIAVGKLINIDELNDTNGLGVIPVGNEGFQNVEGRTGDGLYSLGQVVYVTAVSGNNITFDPPLAWWFTNANSAMATPFPCINTYAGVENLTVYANNTGTENNFTLSSTYACWVKNVESGWCCASADHIAVDSSARDEVRDSYFHDAYDHAPGPHDQALKIRGHSSGTLIEDNILRRLHVAMMLDAVQGNVFAYNLATNGFDVNNCSTCIYADFTTHGAHSLMNLLEGNVLTSFDQDGIWGTSSHGTLLRNFISGQNWVCPPLTGRGPEQPSGYFRQNYYNICVQLAGFANSKYFNVVGNVLGTSGMSSPIGYMGMPPAFGCNTVGYIWSLGYAAGTDYSCGGGGALNSNDNITPWLTLINHGNWDIVSQMQLWSNNISDHVIPQSYYLSGKPAFFGNMKWPPIDPSTGNTNFTAALIPAQYRYFYGTNPPAGPNNQPPIAMASGVPTNGPAPLAVSFSSTGSYDPAGLALSYNWTFGDGTTSTSPNPSHTYQNAGSYTASLAVSDGANTTTSPLLTVKVSAGSTTQLPVAVAIANPTNGTAPLTVSFSSAGSQGTNLVYNWTFGDGSTSTAANPGHTYQAPGTYSAQLKVTSGTNTASSSGITITVAAAVAQPPVAVATATPTSGIAPFSVVFSSSGSSSPQGTPLTYSWTFGDGSTSTTANPSHVYVSWGTYSAQLVVSDGTNSTSSSVLTITAASSGPVAAYGFEEGSGSTTADSSGNGNTGTISGATWTNGYYGRALSFGTNSLVTVSNSASLGLTVGMTLEAWVYPTAINGWMNLIYKPIGSSGWSYVLQGATPSGEVPSLYVSPATSNLMAPSPFALNTWSHAAATYDGATMNLYVNGVLVSSQPQTGTITTSTDALTIGGNAVYGQNWYGQNWNGLIDEVRIYNRALSASEIQTDMNTPVLQRPPAPTGLHLVGP